MTNAQMWSLVVGFVIPPLLAVVQQPSWSAKWRAVVMFVVALLAGAGTAFFTDQFEGKDVTTSVLIVLVTAIATYESFWKKTGIAPAIEKATSPKTP